MKLTKIVRRMTGFFAVFILSALSASTARAHCDSLDGPVVKAAQQALKDGNAKHVLIWVQAKDESIITNALQKARAVRTLNSEARELADHYFYETVVRIHRAGEGAAYTGLKPAGSAKEVITLTDKALATGRIEPVLKLLSHEIDKGVREHFHAAKLKGNFDKNDVEAGRKFVKAYVEYTHYVERIHDVASGSAHAHEGISDAEEVPETH